MWATSVLTTLMVFGSVLLLGQPALGQSPARVALDGTSVYKAYCAPCHGADGKGHGPAAAALKRKPTDLTTIAKNNKGMFPIRTIEDVVTTGGQWKAHGSKEMPTWGPVFQAVDRDDLIATAHIQNLMAYLKSIQLK
jgi:mono/diheme cytochrome c family protein